MKLNIEKTKKYYDSIAQEALCNCSYCKNYYLQIGEKYPKVSSYLHSLGIDIKKPFEISSSEPDEHNILEYYVCQYIVFGCCSDIYSYKIDDVEFRNAQSYPDTDIKEEHFVIEFYPIKLEKIVSL